MFLITVLTVNIFGEFLRIKCINFINEKFITVKFIAILKVLGLRLQRIENSNIRTS